MPIFSGSDPQYKHLNEYFATKLMRLAPGLNKNLLINDLMTPWAQYYKALNLGSVTGINGQNGSVAITANVEPRIWSGSGAPALATVPDGGLIGDLYIRTDTPGTVNQRLYLCTASGTITNGVATLGTFVAYDSALQAAGSYQPAGNYSTVVTTVPTAAAGANAGTTPPAPVVTAGSNDTRGGITFGTGATPAAGVMVQVTFGTPYAAAPFIGLDASTAAASPLFLYVTNITTTGFQIALNAAPAASQANTTYGVQYRVN